MSEPTPTPHLRAIDPDTELDPKSPGGPVLGVTPPHRRGGSGRFLTDVLVELGYGDRQRVERSIEEARLRGTTPERILREERIITAEQLSKAIADRYGLDHVDLGVFKVDMGAANLLSASAAKRYGAVPVAYVDD